MDAGVGAQKLHEALTRMQQGDHATATAAALMALEAFTGANDRTGAAASHQLLGILQLGQGHFEEALSHIDSALPLRESTGDLEGVSALLQERFELCLRTGKLDEARRAMEQQITVHERSGDKEGKAHAMHQLAQLHLQHGRDDIAEVLIQEAFFLMEAPGSERARSALALLYANLWLSRGEPVRALAHAQQGLDLAQQAKFRPAVVDAQQQVGVVLAQNKEFEKARRILEDALVGRELLKDVEGRFQVLQELATVEVSLGEIDHALDRLESAAKGSRSAGHSVGEITALQLLQVAADEHGRPDRALRAAQGLIAATVRHGDVEAMAAAQFSLGTRLAAQTDLVGAEQAFREANRLQRQADLAHEAAVSAGMLGQVLVAKGARAEGLGLLVESLQALEAMGSEAAASVREIIDEIQEQ